MHKQELPELLEEQEINYNKAVIYKTLDSDLSQLDIKKYDMLIFFSPAGVKSLFKNFPDYKQNSTLIAALGPTTAKTITNSGLTLNIKAPTKTAPSMTMAIEQYIIKSMKKK